ncbi:hypothetical protein [Arcticibacter tournemirensis]|uniref:Uncharacterized protein n=1 Tax=Arcticibacter tournemirensis TaxID=699437 RepID=A0A4Q0M4B7_9SPHI|nr:hypothetical protein [Arcticibacter tournemirensis]RXF67734.1 hypothetical protein EKH83_18065 [Arcticibacter tournemirensis]
MGFEVLSSREWALGIWIVVALVAVLFKKSMRDGLGGVLKALFVWNLMSWLVGMAVYIAGFIYLFYRMGLWTPDLLKDTVFYILFSATVSMFKANKISEDKDFFWEMLKDNLKLGILMQFLIGQYTFDVWVELLIVPISVLLAGIQAFSVNDPKYAQVNKLINRIWLLFGAAVIYHMINSVIQHIHELLSLDILRQILLVPNLTLVFIPFLYVLSLRMVYEEQFILLNFKLRDKKLFRFAKREAILKFRTDLQGLKRWVNRWNLSHPQTREEILATIGGFKEQQQLEKEPPVVLPSQGWSPYLAKDWLSDEKLKPAYYDPAYEEKWSARSAQLKLAKDWSGNGITYNVTGTRLAADELELRLAAYEPKNPAELQKIFQERVCLLYQQATGVAVPQKLKKALQHQKNIKFKEGIYFISLEKSVWGNITEGYDLIFTISIQNDRS